MDLHLGLASFAYKISELHKNWKISGLRTDGIYIYVYSDRGKSQDFQIMYGNDPRLVDCGYIKTDNKAIDRLLGIDMGKELLEFCEKNNNSAYNHCPVEKSKKLRNEVKEIEIDTHQFDCKLY